MSEVGRGTADRSPLGPWRLLGRRFRRNRVAVSGALILGVLYLLSCGAGFLSPYRYDDGDTNSTVYGPMLLGGYHAELSRKHVFEDVDGSLVELSEFDQVWRFFDGGIHFHDSEGRFLVHICVGEIRI